MDNKIYPEHLSTSEFSAGSACLRRQGSALGGQKGNSDSPLLSEESNRGGQDRPAYLVVSETESFPHVIKYARPPRLPWRTGQGQAGTAGRGSAYFSRREFFKTFPMQLMKSIGFCLTGNWEEGERAGPGKRIRLDIERCLAWGGADCQLCYLACPLREQAIIMEDQKPVLMASVCDGCGLCVRACETVNNHPALKIV